jgi:uncharacterized protein (DUF2141 family)
MKILLRTGLAVLLAFAGASPAWAQRGQGPPPPAQPRDTRTAAAALAAVPAGTSAISGTVGVAGVGTAARRARVTLGVAGGGPSRTTTTDDNGRFVFAGLLAGRYTLSASKPGHVSVSFGQTKPGRPGTPIQLADGQQFSARLTIYKGSVITGVVLDENGDAIPGTQIRLLRYVMQSGQRTLQQSGSATTDDRGLYRAYGLQPGDYVVSAMPRNTGGPGDVEQMMAELSALQRQLADDPNADEARKAEIAVRASMLKAQMPEKDEVATGYAPVYYPGTTLPAQAGVVNVAAGEEKGGIDFQLQRVAVARVDGLVISSTGQPLQNVQITLSGTGNPVPGFDVNGTRVDNDGKFRLNNVPPGQYVLSAVSNGNGGPGMPPVPPVPPAGGRGAAPAQRPEPVRMWAMTDLNVDGRNVSNIILTLQAGLTLTGRLAFDGNAQPPADLTRARINLQPIDSPGVARPPMPNAAGRVDASGKFTIGNIVPGKYRLTAAVPGNGNTGAMNSGWTVESSVVDGQDSLDFPLEIKPGTNLTNAVITMTDRQAELSGTITNGRGEPVPDFTILVYPSEQRFWTPNARRIRTARPGTDGRFTFSNLPPGDYRLVPITDVEPGSWFDPAFLQQIDPSSIRVTISDGEKKTQDLRVGG